MATTHELMGFTVTVFAGPRRKDTTNTDNRRLQIDSGHPSPAGYIVLDRYQAEALQEWLTKWLRGDFEVVE